MPRAHHVTSALRGALVTAAAPARRGALLTVAALALAGCAASGSDADDAASPGPAGSQVTITDAWVKAADTGMTAAFGTLANTGPADITVTSAESEASSAVELHETVQDEAGQMTMRQVEGGFVIPAGQELALEPGGNHLMLMGLTDALEAGEEATFTLTFSDGSTYEFTAPVKDFTGANENYEGDDAETDPGH